MNQVFKILLALSFSSTAFTATEKITMQKGKVQTDDQFANYVMNGLNGSLEYSQLNADFQLKMSNGTNTITSKQNSNSAAPAMGVSINFANLPRNNSGWSVGATLINKLENDSKDHNSLKSLKSFTQIRPEGNLGYALSNGIWGMVGGHLSVLTTSDIDFVTSLGTGLQASLGYTPVRNFGLDIGYYLSYHSISDKSANEIESDNRGFAVKKNESWVIFNQLRARAIYYF